MMTAARASLYIYIYIYIATQRVNRLSFIRANERHSVVNGNVLHPHARQNLAYSCSLFSFKSLLEVIYIIYIYIYIIKKL